MCTLNIQTVVFREKRRNIEISPVSPRLALNTYSTHSADVNEGGSRINDQKRKTFKSNSNMTANTTCSHPKSAAFLRWHLHRFCVSGTGLIDRSS